MRRITDEERLTSVLRWDVKTWMHASGSRNNNWCYCVKCGTEVGEYGKTRKKLCIGKKSFFRRREKCPHDISHFHFQCNKCDGKWVEAARDEGPTDYDKAVASVKKAYENLMNNSNGEVKEEDLIRIWREIVSKDLIEK